MAKRKERPGAFKVTGPKPSGWGEKSRARAEKRPLVTPSLCLQVSCGKCGNGLGHEFINDGPKRGQSRF